MSKRKLPESIQPDLFASEESHTKSKSRPLAFNARPESLEQFIGQKKVFQRYPFLTHQKDIPSLVLFGPAGCGKTTLAHILAKKSGREFYKFNAVTGGVNDLKKLITSAEEIKAINQKEYLIFIDEIHRFNKAQQDALLPHIEEGDFVLIGATTENPRSSVNRALLSRMHTIELSPLSREEILVILVNASQKFELKLDQACLEIIADYARGDARGALNILESASKLTLATPEVVKKMILENARDYDKDGNRHYDVISAFIKSMRGSDPSAALLYLAVMLDGGEDPVFIARRLVIFASEDVGNADPMGLVLATAGLQAVAQIGMPEARINLAQVVTYLASTVKSNAAYEAINAAMSYVENHATIEIPDHLKNFSPPGSAPYLYPHSYPGHWVKQDYTKENIPHFYQPTQMGKEENIKRRLDSLK